MRVKAIYVNPPHSPTKRKNGKRESMRVHRRKHVSYLVASGSTHCWNREREPRVQSMRNPITAQLTRRPMMLWYGSSAAGPTRTA